jgi:hypothetical protein
MANRASEGHDEMMPRVSKRLRFMWVTIAAEQLRVSFPMRSIVPRWTFCFLSSFFSKAVFVHVGKAHTRSCCDLLFEFAGIISVLKNDDNAVGLLDGRSSLVQ